MLNECSKIVFSNRAYNAVVSETYDKISTETGGIFLGRVIDEIWYVVEVVDPGPDSIFTVTYFEYDTPYVNHLAKVVSKQYSIELAVLGLWHRHPGSMDTFSSTDDGTNTEFAKLHPHGAISGLVNIDPNLRLTVYHVSLPLRYESVPYEIGDSLIPNSLLEMKFTARGLSDFSPNSKKNQVPVDNNNGKNSAIGNFFNSLLDKVGTTIIINNYFTPVPVVSGADSNEDILIDIYAKEELEMENDLGVDYKSHSTGERMVYSVTGYKSSADFPVNICFEVSLDDAEPRFYCGVTNYPFSPGIFKRYVQSRLAEENFTG